MAKPFAELTRDFSPERRERIEAKKAALREEMELAGQSGSSAAAIDQPPIKK